MLKLRSSLWLLKVFHLNWGPYNLFSYCNVNPESLFFWHRFWLFLVCVLCWGLAHHKQHCFCELQCRYNFSFSPFCLWYSTEDPPESPSGPSSPKVALLPPVLKKVPSDKEKDGQSSPSVRSFSQEGRGICVTWCLLVKFNVSLSLDLFSLGREEGYAFEGAKSKENVSGHIFSISSTHLSLIKSNEQWIPEY